MATLVFESVVAQDYITERTRTCGRRRPIAERLATDCQTL